MSLKNSRENSKSLLSAVIATGAGASLDISRQDSKERNIFFQADADASAGAFSVDVDVEVSNDDVNFHWLGTISLSGTAGTVESDGFLSKAWPFVRGNVIAISGTDTAVNLTVRD